MPHLARRLVSICSPWPDVTLGSLKSKWQISKTMFWGLISHHQTGCGGSRSWSLTRWTPSTDSLWADEQRLYSVFLTGGWKIPWKNAMRKPIFVGLVPAISSFTVVTKSFFIKKKEKEKKEKQQQQPPVNVFIVCVCPRRVSVGLPDVRTPEAGPGGGFGWAARGPRYLQPAPAARPHGCRPVSASDTPHPSSLPP